ncbi:acetoacetate--CoA ligase [Streptomyces sp. B21-083]|uniref:acetoacetate--CoA ligase n=1 Tax=Streptomyces sp. B21-083 TaxID=3039410 RepID=UPI002FEF86FE
MSQSVSAPDLLWHPPADATEGSAMRRFAAFVADRHAVRADTYEELWSWSVDHLDDFWAAVWDFCGVRSSQPYTAVLADRRMPGAVWFPGARLNYAEQVFRRYADDRPALVVIGEGDEAQDISWAELRRQVGALAQQFRDWGVRPGDRVAAYLPNIPHTIVGLLASASVGAVWATCAPDYGVQGAVDRFAQIEPTVLLVADGYRYGGRQVDRTADASAIAEALPTARHVITVPYLGLDGPSVEGAVSWEVATGVDAEPVFDQVPFDHPLWILYSSGTTGVPKGIVQGHGGIVLEHLKAIALHWDVKPGDRVFQFTSTAWMMWNVLASSLLAGAVAIVYDGSPTWPSKGALFEVAARTRATHFATGAGYLTACHKAGVEPGADHDLSALRYLMTGGSPLPQAEWRWIYEQVKDDVWLDNTSGGTDVCSGYFGGTLLKPVYLGESQCRMLGTRVEAWNDEGKPVTDEVGELVVTAPMPSMPLYFWNDPDGSRYRGAYFGAFPGVWRHGDWITVTSRGTAVVHGRSDSTINRHGVRMGSADIHAAVERFPEVADCMVIGAELPDGGYYLPLFVVLADGAVFDEDLKRRISETIRTTVSPRHVPDEIIVAPHIPHTLTGKRLEVPVKRLIQGHPLAKVAQPSLVDRPESLIYYAEVGRRIAERRAPEGNPSA